MEPLAEKEIILTVSIPSFFSLPSMTIFDKLSGFAHKAKENALSRAILAKDKRLDKSLSESLDATHIGLSKMSSFGIPGRVSAVAYDPVCGLLAIGGGVEPDTYIRIFGKGISTSLTLSSATRIKYLQFQTGSPTLVAVDMKNIVTTYDLKTKRARHVVATPSIVTSLAHCTGTDWLFIGFADGNVDMFDMEAGAFGEEYGIPNLCLDEDQQQQQQQQNQQQNPSPPPHNVVVAIQMHPADLDLVLVGYDSAVFLWSIRDQNIKKCFIVPQRASSKEEIRLTCLTWSPCGTRFMAGYDNGYMHLWDTRNDHKSLLARRVFHAGSPTEESPCEPIYNMAWYVDDTARKSFLVVAGGSDLPDIRGLHVLEYDLDTSDLRDARKQTILSTSVDVSDFILLNSEPYFLGMHNPLGLLLVGTDGAVRAYGLDHGHPHLVLPPALQFLDPPVEQAYYLSQLPHKVFQELIAPPSRVPQRRDLYLPLTGGIAGNGHIYRIPSNDLLLTVHGKSTLRFWDASYTSLRPLSSRTIDCSEVLESKNNSNNCNIQHVVLDHHTGTILLAMEDNAILVFIPDAVEEKQSPGAGQQQHHSDVQQKFIDNCEETLDEITQLLEDMNNVEEEDVSQPPPASTDDTAHQQHSEATPPLPPRQSSTPPTQRESDQQLQEQPKELKQSPNDENNPFVESTQPSPSSPPPQQQQQQQTEVIATEAETTTTLIEEKSPGVKIDLLDIPIERSGFTLTMKVSVEDGTITKMVCI
ncbi:WD40-repeat-containing domain protein [Phascolomyces articulosus]|uniref:WD40-repeat-containing domain protein n=1 Tax=Phascolomyces articulosus TaxID=60185 RepID=A0AAD5KY63_9FUNG|nr:WD40-repeat-containing domain protein [Phascolomyces articulosus]